MKKIEFIIALILLLSFSSCCKKADVNQVDRKQTESATISKSEKFTCESFLKKYYSDYHYGYIGTSKDFTPKLFHGKRNLEAIAKLMEKIRNTKPKKQVWTGKFPPKPKVDIELRFLLFNLLYFDFKSVTKEDIIKILGEGQGDSLGLEESALKYHFKCDFLEYSVSKVTKGLYFIIIFNKNKVKEVFFYRDTM